MKGKNDQDYFKHVIYPGEPLLSLVLYFSTRQGPHSNPIYKFPVLSQFFHGPTGNFPCADFRNFISETDFEFFFYFTANIAISCIFRIKEFST